MRISDPVNVVSSLGVTHPKPTYSLVQNFKFLAQWVVKVRLQAQVMDEVDDAVVCCVFFSSEIIALHRE